MSKEKNKTECTFCGKEVIKNNQIELPFNYDKDKSCLNTQAKIININLIKEQKKIDLINQIIQNTPSF